MYVIVEYPVRYPLAKRFGGSRTSDKEGGGGHPEIGGVGLKKNYSALQASVWSKNKGGPIRQCQI